MITIAQWDFDNREVGLVDLFLDYGNSALGLHIVLIFFGHSPSVYQTVSFITYHPSGVIITRRV